MPLTDKGQEIMAHMKKEYGEKKGEGVFYASANAGKIKGVHEEVQAAVEALQAQMQEADVHHIGNDLPSARLINRVDAANRIKKELQTRAGLATPAGHGYHAEREIPYAHERPNGPGPAMEKTITQHATAQDPAAAPPPVNGPLGRQDAATALHKEIVVTPGEKGDRGRRGKPGAAGEPGRPGETGPAGPRGSSWPAVLAGVGAGAGTGIGGTMLARRIEDEGMESIQSVSEGDVLDKYIAASQTTPGALAEIGAGFLPGGGTVTEIPHIADSLRKGKYLSAAGHTIGAGIGLIPGGGAAKTALKTIGQVGAGMIGDEQQAKHDEAKMPKLPNLESAIEALRESWTQPMQEGWKGAAAGGLVGGGGNPLAALGAGVGHGVGSLVGMPKIGSAIGATALGGPTAGIGAAAGDALGGNEPEAPKLPKLPGAATPEAVVEEALMALRESWQRGSRRSDTLEAGPKKPVYGPHPPPGHQPELQVVHKPVSGGAVGQAIHTAGEKLGEYTAKAGDALQRGAQNTVGRAFGQTAGDIAGSGGGALKHAGAFMIRNPKSTAAAAGLAGAAGLKYALSGDDGSGEGATIGRYIDRSPEVRMLTGRPAVNPFAHESVQEHYVPSSGLGSQPGGGGLSQEQYDSRFVNGHPEGALVSEDTQNVSEVSLNPMNLVRAGGRYISGAGRSLTRAGLSQQLAGEVSGSNARQLLGKGMRATGRFIRDNPGTAATTGAVLSVPIGATLGAGIGSLTGAGNPPEQQQPQQEAIDPKAEVKRIREEEGHCQEQAEKLLVKRAAEGFADDAMDFTGKAIKATTTPPKTILTRNHGESISEAVKAFQKQCQEGNWGDIIGGGIGAPAGAAIGYGLAPAGYEKAAALAGAGVGGALGSRVGRSIGDEQRTEHERTVRVIGNPPRRPARASVSIPTQRGEGALEAVANTPEYVAKVDGGYKVKKEDGSGSFSKKPQTKEKAEAQLRAIEMHKHAHESVQPVKEDGFWARYMQEDAARAATSTYVAREDEDEPTEKEDGDNEKNVEKEEAQEAGPVASPKAPARSDMLRAKMYGRTYDQAAFAKPAAPAVVAQPKPGELSTAKYLTSKEAIEALKESWTRPTLEYQQAGGGLKASMPLETQNAYKRLMGQKEKPQATTTRTPPTRATIAKEAEGEGGRLGLSTNVKGHMDDKKLERHSKKEYEGAQDSHKFTGRPLSERPAHIGLPGTKGKAFGEAVGSFTEDFATRFPTTHAVLNHPVSKAAGLGVIGGLAGRVAVHGANKVVGDPNEEQFDQLAASIDRLGDRIGRKRKVQEDSMPPQEVVGYDAEGPDKFNETAGGRLPSDDALMSEVDAMREKMCQPSMQAEQTNTEEGVAGAILGAVLGAAKGAAQGLMTGNPLNAGLGTFTGAVNGGIGGYLEAIAPPQQQEFDPHKPFGHLKNTFVGKVAGMEAVGRNYKGPGVTSYEDIEKQATDKPKGEKEEELKKGERILLDATKKLQEAWRSNVMESPMRAAFGLAGGGVGAYGGQHVGSIVGGALDRAAGGSGEVGSEIGKYAGGLGGGYLGATGGLGLHDEYQKADRPHMAATEALTPDTHAASSERAIPQLGRAMEAVNELRNYMMRPARRQ